MAYIDSGGTKSNDSGWMSPAKYRPNQQIAHTNHAPDYVVVLQHGWAVRYRMMVDGRRQITYFYIPGDVCGLFWLHGNHDGQPVQAVGDVHGVRLSCSSLLGLARSTSRYFDSLTAEIELSTALLSEHGVTLGRRTAAERIAHVFCEMHERMSAAGYVRNGEFPMPMTQTDLADLVGLTAIHVNRVLQELRGAHLIELKARRLKILDPERLKRLAMFDPRYLVGLLKCRLHQAIPVDHKHIAMIDSVRPNISVSGQKISA